jgi:hypothetical protein
MERETELMLSGNELKALSSAYVYLCEHPEITKRPMDEYDIYLDESDISFCVHFLVKDRLNYYGGKRRLFIPIGSPSGVLEPTVEVEKESGKVVNFFYQR